MIQALYSTLVALNCYKNTKENINWQCYHKQACTYMYTAHDRDS